MTAYEGEGDVGDGEHAPFTPGARAEPKAVAEACQGRCDSLLGGVDPLSQIGYRE